MDITEKAQIIAIAKLLGTTKSDQEILEEYSRYYQEALVNLKTKAEPSRVEVFKRPF